MTLYLIVAITFVMLVAAVIFKGSLWAPLVVSLFLFIIYVRRRKFSWKQIGIMIFYGVKKAMVVIRVFIFIGALTAAWMAAGTIPALVYGGINIISPNLFIVSAFLICCAMSFLLGTSFGTANTLGVVMMTIAKSSGVNLYMTAAAIICGIYFGDRSSPMSSSLILVSTLTKTKQYTNVKNAVKSAVVPLILATVLFVGLSVINPMDTAYTDLSKDILKTFDISIITLAPAAVIFIMCILKIDVKYAMIASIVCGGIVAVAIQGYGIIEVLKFIFFGFELPKVSPLADLIRGGGFISMLEAAVLVALSCAIAGIFEGGNLLKNFMPKKEPKTRAGLFSRTVAASVVTSAVGCNQTIAIVMTVELMKNSYENMKITNEEFAKDITMTASILCAAIPWNIAVLTPVTTFGLSGSGYLPFLFFLYLLPLYHFVVYSRQGKSEM